VGSAKEAISKALTAPVFPCGWGLSWLKRGGRQRGKIDQREIGSRIQTASSDESRRRRAQLVEKGEIGSGNTGFERDQQQK